MIRFDVKGGNYQLRNQWRDTSRETSIRRVMLSYSQIEYQKLTLRSHTSKEEPKERN